MDQQLSINVSHNIPELDLIQEVASHRNVSEAFIEKAILRLERITSYVSNRYATAGSLFICVKLTLPSFIDLKFDSMVVFLIFRGINLMGAI